MLEGREKTWFKEITEREVKIKKNVIYQKNNRLQLPDVISCFSGVTQNARCISERLHLVEIVLQGNDHKM